MSRGRKDTGVLRDGVYVSIVGDFLLVSRVEVLMSPGLNYETDFLILFFVRWTIENGIKGREFFRIAAPPELSFKLRGRRLGKRCAYNFLFLFYLTP